MSWPLLWHHPLERLWFPLRLLMATRWAPRPSVRLTGARHQAARARDRPAGTRYTTSPLTRVCRLLSCVVPRHQTLPFGPRRPGEVIVRWHVRPHARWRLDPLLSIDGKRETRSSGGVGVLFLPLPRPSMALCRLGAGRSREHTCLPSAYRRRGDDADCGRCTEAGCSGLATRAGSATQGGC